MSGPEPLAPARVGRNALPSSWRAHLLPIALLAALSAVGDCYVDEVARGMALSRGGRACVPDPYEGAQLGERPDGEQPELSSMEVEYMLRGRHRTSVDIVNKNR